MSLFNQIINALDNSNQEGNSGQLAGIFNTVQQLSNNAQADPSTLQSALSIVGNYTRSALQEKRANEGEQQTEAFVNQFSGTQPNNQAVNLLFSTPQIQQLIQEVSERTGLNPGIIQAILPTLVPIVLNLLKTGADPQNPGASNPVLNSFLDADGDGDVDIADAMQMASRYLSR